MPKRTTIGFLVDFFTDDYQTEILNGIKKEAELADANLICYCGGPLNPPEAHHSPRKAVYDLPDPNSVDGLIILGATIGNFVDSDALKQFYMQYKSIPCMSIGVDIGMENVPSILIDNSVGMKNAIEHLVTAHGYKRIAFICGTADNREAELRLDAYKEVLKSHGIPIDPELICPGNFYFGSGKNAVRLLLDERKAEFDALVGSNDLMSLEAMRELQRRGIRVPYDVAVVGFDDIEESRYVSPPLTTVRQPLFTIGQDSVKIVMSLIRGEHTERICYFPTEVTLRSSCGCNTNKRRFRSEPGKNRVSGNSLDWNLKDEYRGYVERTLATPHSFVDSTKWAASLSEALLSAVEKNDIDVFIMEFNSFILHLNADGDDVLEWQPAIRDIVDTLFSLYNDESRTDFFQILTGRVSDTFNEHKLDQLFTRKKQSNEFSRSLHIASIELTTTFSLAKLKEIMRTTLPNLGINHFYIIRSLRDKPQRVWIYMSYNAGNILELSSEESVCGKSEILSTLRQNDDSRFSFVILALYFKNEQIGYAVYDMAPIDGFIYETLNIQLSSTLTGARLINEIEETQREILYTLGDVLERRSFETGSHVKRVAEYSYLLAIKYGLGEEDAQLLKHASPMHDVGKLGIEETILKKPDKLTIDEFESVKAHTTIGYEILKSSERTLLKIASIIAHQHHEHFDGTGYPLGLAGEDIHIFGRITCLADVFDALGSHRVYKQEWTMERIIRFLQEQNGKMFDPKLVELFFENLDEILYIRKSF